MKKFSSFKYNESEKLVLDSLLKNEELLRLISEDSRYSYSPELVIRVCFNRGLRTAEDIYSNLTEPVGGISTIPMKGEREFLDRLYKAITNNELIVIMGDYDTDGAMATTLMFLGIRCFTKNVFYHMNSRFVEGYGLKVPTVNEILAKHPETSLIITVDNGIRSFEAIDYCNSLGIDVLVTDHHSPAETLPNAYAVVDPKQEGCMYPFDGLCGAGVAYKLVCDYIDKYHAFDFATLKFIDDLVWICAIATVGDRVPMVFDNRVIVKRGLKYMNDPDCEIQFIKTLKEKLNKDKITEDTLGFYISPMINAMGRLEGNPIDVVEALITSDEDRIEEIINHMDEVNQIRRDLTAKNMDDALNIVGKNPSQKILVVYNSSYQEGIVGLIASRLTEKFYRPSVVLCTADNGDLKGSARSIPGIDLMDILDSVKDLLVTYGGHPPAAGLTVQIDKLDELTVRLNEYMERYSDESFVEHIKSDLILGPGMINLDVCNLLDNIGPYGQDFPRPYVYLKEFKVDKELSIKNKSNSFYVGETGNTLRLLNSERLTLIGFKSAERYKKLEEPEVFDCIGYPSINRFKEYVNAQFQIENNYIIKR